MKKLVYILFLCIITSAKTDRYNESIWISKASAIKVKRNIYLVNIRLVNVINDTCLLEVPYPHSFDLTASENYFLSKYYFKKIDKNYFSDEPMYDTLNKDKENKASDNNYLVHFSPRDYVKLIPGQIIDMKFGMYCARNYRNINLKFKYHLVKDSSLGDNKSTYNSQYLRINFNLNKL